MSTSSALLQIGVFTAPGAMMMTSIPNSISSRRRLSDSPSMRVLGGGIGRRHRIAVLAGDRGDHHDPPLRSLQGRIGAEQRAESLGRNDRPDEVDLHLAAEFVGGEFEHGTRDRNAGIVDEAGERFAVEGAPDLARGGQHGGLIGDVEDQRREVRAELALEAVGVGLLAHAAEYAKAAVEQQSLRWPSRCRWTPR